jgi:diguanylate cyclase (GGDEF)-like protein
MVNTLRSANILNLATKLPSGRAEASRQRAQKTELVSTLMRDLQSSLEIDEILTLFFNEIRSVLAIDGLSYSQEPLDIQFNTQFSGKHQVTYDLNAGEETLGVMIFSQNKRFGEDDLETLENIMPCLLYPLRNALKYQSAIKVARTDSLTGCGNRSSLEINLDREINIARRDEIPFSAMMFDLDHFKMLNDTHGHQCGDLVLKQAVQEVQKITRKTDMLFRYGGEEFVLLLHKTDLKKAAYVAEKVRLNIEQMEIRYQNKPINISISLGVAELAEFDNITSMIERVDTALYAAKKQGRNRVSLSAAE